MANNLSTVDFLQSIDSDLVKYAERLCSNGFTSTASLAHVTAADLSDIPEGHRRLILHQTLKLRSPNGPPVDDTSSRSRRLHPRVLFSNSQSNYPRPHIPNDSSVLSTFVTENEVSSDIPDDYETEQTLASLEYSTPLEKHLNKIHGQIQDKQSRIDSLKESIQKFLDLTTSNSGTFGSYSCGRCHQFNHKKPKCRENPCLSAISCGQLKLHKDESKRVDTQKAEVRKLQKEMDSLQVQADKTSETMKTMAKSFPTVVRGPLIRSNPSEYLTKNRGQWIPLTRKINLHLSILQKYYQNKIPEHIESESTNFQSIIDKHYQRYDIKERSIQTMLKDRICDLERQEKHRTCNPSFTPSSSTTGIYSQNFEERPNKVLRLDYRNETNVQKPSDEISEVTHKLGLMESPSKSLLTKQTESTSPSGNSYRYNSLSMQATPMDVRQFSQGSRSHLQVPVLLPTTLPQSPSYEHNTLPSYMYGHTPPSSIQNTTPSFTITTPPTSKSTSDGMYPPTGDCMSRPIYGHFSTNTSSTQSQSNHPITPCSTGSVPFKSCPTPPFPKSHMPRPHSEYIVRDGYPSSSHCSSGSTYEAKDEDGVIMRASYKNLNGICTTPNALQASSALLLAAMQVSACRDQSWTKPTVPVTFSDFRFTPTSNTTTAPSNPTFPTNFNQFNLTSPHTGNILSTTACSTIRNENKSSVSFSTHSVTDKGNSCPKVDSCSLVEKQPDESTYIEVD